MNRGKQHIDEELLIRFIIGEANKKESSFVLEWIDLSDENKQRYQQLQRVWAAIEKPKDVIPASVNVDVAWNRLKSRMDQYKDIEDKLEKKQRSISFYLMRVAAVLVFGLLIYIVYNYQARQLMQVQIASSDSTLTNNQLPDGSSISLNKNTSIEYSKDFAEKERKVKMTGEAFFDVEPDSTKPFIIEAQDAIITVLGTAFNVKALSEDEAVEVLVQEGLVELANQDKSQVTKLRIGEKGIYIKETNQVKKETEVDVESLYWLNKTLLFRDTKLSMVFEILERLYEVSIQIDNDKILECTLTAKFSNESIDNILDHISTIFDLEIVKNENNILIRGNGCP